MASREEVTIEIDARTLASLRDLAKNEGLELGILVGEALEDLIAKRQGGKPRTGVMASYETSHQTFAPLYKKLAD